MRLCIERRGARVWLTAPGGRKASLMLSDAEGLAGMVERIDVGRDLCDIRIQDVGVRRLPSGSSVLVHAGDDVAECHLSDFDIGTFARMLKLAASSRIFTGSIGTVGRKTDARPVEVPVRCDATVVDPVPSAPTTPAPRFVAGPGLADFDLSRGRRHGQAEPFRTLGGNKRATPDLPTFSWQPPSSLELQVVDAMPAGVFAAMRAMWLGFDHDCWIGVEWVRNYAGAEVWRTTRRDRPVTNRQEISGSTMVKLERHGLVADGGTGLRVPSQGAYDLWRATRLAGGTSHIDELMCAPVDVPMGLSAAGMEDVADLGTCIVSFHMGKAVARPVQLSDDDVGGRLASILIGMGIRDPRTAEIATRIGEGLYPERHSYYGDALHHRLERGPGRVSTGRSDMGTPWWSPHFPALVSMPPWQTRAIERYRTARTATSIPVVMPAIAAPDDWRDDPLLRKGADKRHKLMLSRRRSKEDR